MPRKSAVVTGLVTNEANKKAVTFHIDPSVDQEIKVVKLRVSKERPDLAFSPDLAAEEGLKRAMAAIKELLDKAARNAGAEKAGP
jgi:hypothetical protein